VTTSTSHQHRPARRAAFTLIELLVVIGIIVVLIGILVPVVSRVRTAAQAASVRAQLSSLQSAIESYHQEFKAFPGPLDNNQIHTDGSSFTIPSGMFLLGTAAFPEVDKISMAENLVLGLLGGLRPGETVGTFVFDPNLVGKGPNSLNRANPKKYPAFIEAKDLSWSDNQPSDTTQGPGDATGFYADDAWTDRATGTKMDSPIPEIVDRFPNPMPILYLRARVGVNIPATAVDPDNNPIITDGTGTRPGPYDISQIAGYTFSEGDNIGSPANAPTGKSIGGGKSVKLKDYTPAATGDVPFHGLRRVTVGANPATMVPGAEYQYPYNAYPYFLNRSASGAGGPQPKQKDGYILISAGADRVYGTADDIASFGNVTD